MALVHAPNSTASSKLVATVWHCAPHLGWGAVRLDFAINCCHQRFAGTCLLAIGQIRLEVSSDMPRSCLSSPRLCRVQLEATLYIFPSNLRRRNALPKVACRRELRLNGCRA